MSADDITLDPEQIQVACNQLAGRIPKERLEGAPRSCLDSLEQSQSEKDGALEVDLACSGGADSVCLVALVWAHWPELRPWMRVLHFNHSLRGQESDLDEALVRALAASLELRFESERWRFPPENPSESQMREARLAFFERKSSCQTAQTFLLTGHNADDVAETVLMRLARGSGPTGLCAPRLVSHESDTKKSRVYRMLLRLRKTEIVEALSAVGLPWREDDSNRSLNYTRNRIRHQVIPRWQEAVPHDVLQGVVRSRRLLEEADTAIEHYVRKAAAVYFDSDEDLDLSWYETGDMRFLKGQALAVERRALEGWMNANGLAESIGPEAFDEILRQLTDQDVERRFSAGPNRFIIAGKYRLRVERREPVEEWDARTLSDGDEAALPGGMTLRARFDPIDQVASAPNKPAPPTDLELDRSYVRIAWEGEAFLVRPWQPGDRYTPLGAPGSRKLQDMFTDRKVPVAERKLLPVVCNASDEGDVLWVPGLPPAEKCRILSSSTRAVTLTYRPA